ncbi:2-hydroxychromene-2-carboxylate isomerase [Pseudenhygromyxa sp. WMMC2535]|uniref:2-hydroxychromene-2-carboxylate isomerase n=1 Tax=Pseudenhygromyxa sp. WMMC2535 TaxID=2712867 RepID=UPI001556AB7E|nr:2-hydroxychromene-2-carboxylate isomerase [Pseudenhygromyxa sp. WMMC2535]NVB37983.1 2-hydroxychromene-2-carboxylate isomerase [Pseudenhygromyxa sp. WMMC2535]
MTGRALRVYLDFSCPYAYLAAGLVEGLAARCEAQLDVRPMLLGGVFRARQTPQNLSSVLSPAKARHNMADMQRQAAMAGVPLRMPAGHPMRTVEALRAVLVVGPPYLPLMHHFYRAYWVDGVEISSPEGLREVLGRAGLSARADEILARIEAPEIKQALRDRTDEAIAAGVFGAPTFVIDVGEGEALYWGTDRIAMVEARLRGGAVEREAIPPTRAPMDVFFDYSSPFAYLGCAGVERRIAAGELDAAQVRWRPMLLGAVFKQVDMVNVPLFSLSEAKRRHTSMDIERQAAALDAPYRFPSRFPMKTVLPLRVSLAAGVEGVGDEAGRRLIQRIFRAYWAEDRDIADPEVVAGLATDCGLDGRALVEAAGSPEIKAALRRVTDEAVAAGVFGAPTFVVHDDHGPELFWGADRLDFALRAAGGDPRMRAV